MPQYSYKHPTEEQFIDVIQTMKEEHKYFDANGLEWERVWTRPQTCIDSKWSIWSDKDFAKKSGEKKGTYGDLVDKAAELSAIRTEKEGKDPIKEKHFEDYKLRTKKEHPIKVKEEWDNKVIEI